MAYYTRILGLENPDIHLDEIVDALEAEDLDAGLGYAEDETPENWTYLEITTPEKEPIVIIERNVIAEGELGFDEVNEFRALIADEKPASAAQWLQEYLNKVKVIYAFQMMDASMLEENYPIVNSLRTTIWNRTGGILQADNEGFANEDGYHILWQFDDEVSGEWSCAVINEAGEWTNFMMDLGDKQQRKEFFDGKVPAKSHLL